MDGWLLGFLVAAAVLFAVKLVFVISVAGTLPVTKGAMYVPSAHVRIKAVFDAVPLEKDDVFYDLGCGDGRALAAAFKRFGVEAIGYEINPMAFLQAWAKTRMLRGVKVRLRNFMKEDLSRADMVFVYLFPDALHSIKEKLEKELKPGAVVVSCNFPVPGWKPKITLKPESERHADPVYIYVMMDNRG